MSGTKQSVTSMIEDIVGCKWSMELLRLLSRGRHRPSELLRKCSGLSSKVLHERLQKMMNYGIVERTVAGEKPPLRVEYGLTELGRRFIRIIKEVENLQAAIDRGELCSQRASDDA